MQQFRQNPITGHWVILAENRGGRPQEVDIQQIVRPQSVCPFCEGHEERTPDEVFAIRDQDSKANGPGWRVRVVPNKYPALESAGGHTASSQLHRGPAASSTREDGGDVVPGLGIHEIIIESPRHLESITQLSDGQVAEVLEVYRQRLTALRQTKKYHAAVIFKNGGPAAGSTLVHLHSQLMALGIGGPAIGDRLARFQSHAERFGQCPLCQTLGQLRGNEQWVVGGTPNFVAYCPFASRFAYEMWIAPRQHAAHFDPAGPEDMSELSGLLRTVLVKLERIVKLPAYNYIVHTAPFDTLGSDHYHWHIEILPRTTSLAGFELGAGCYINTVPPERAAAALREA
jgi:UDPglucose--hexose-1-phosphate uridylyltransferase